MLAARLACEAVKRRVSASVQQWRTPTHTCPGQAAQAAHALGILITLNFGPAHPAAHGVFRLLVVLNSENVLAITHTQGLLWRCTESLVEYRNCVLATGYYARLDYVAYFAQEIGFNPDKGRVMTSTKALLQKNSIANHLLNVACTIADAGVLGAILWLFEIREIHLEHFEKTTGARLHSNLGFLGVSASAPTKSWESSMEIFALMLHTVGSVRISRGRMFANFVVTAEMNLAYGATGWLGFSTGLSDCVEFEFNPVLVGGVRADSLVRHLGRISACTRWEQSASSKLR